MINPIKLINNHILKAFTLITSLALLLLPGLVNAKDTGWVIKSFDVNLIVNQNTSIDIIETIKVDFKQLSRHGIYRNIPIRYKTPGGNNLNIRLKVLSVTDSNGKSIPYSTSTKNNDIKIKIGDKNKTVTGQQTYTIKYTASRVLRYSQETSEIYWNVTGNQWPVEILSANATVNLPSAIIKTICYTGEFGSTQQNCLSNANNQTAVFTSTQPLSPSQGLTVAVEFPTSDLNVPGILSQAFWFILDNWIYLIPMAAFILMCRIYWQNGRDKRYKSIFNQHNGEIETLPLFSKLHIPTIYSPPKDISPGEVGTLFDEKVDMRDITAIVIDLARRGYLIIKENTTKKLGLIKSTSFILINTFKDQSSLLPFETSVLSMIFATKDTKSANIDKLHSKSYLHLDKTKDQLYEHLTNEGYFKSHPQNIRSLYFVSGIAIILIGSIVSSILSDVTSISLQGSVVSFALTGIIVLVFAPFMPKRTAKGSQALADIIGLKKWLQVGAWRHNIHERLGIFEELLPFAIAFDQTKQFIKAFDKANIQSPEWYQSNQLFNATRFNNSFSTLGNKLNTSVASSRPKSSSGGSGFSGGSSGGGSGGGGGGSW